MHNAATVIGTIGIRREAKKKHERERERPKIHAKLKN